ncbi:MAG TPA: hypothetical protein VIM44_03455, partial [Rariglobus sp.]
VTARVFVGVLPMPIKKPGARTIKAVNDLIADGYARRFGEWRRNPVGWGSPPALHETARCADEIIARFFPT